MMRAGTFLLTAALLLATTSGTFAQKSLVYVDPVDLTQLRTECQTNPNGYSWTEGGVTQTLAQWYAGGFDQIVANILNQTRAAITIYRTDVSPQDVHEAIALGQFVASGTQTQYNAAWLTGFWSMGPLRLLNRNGGDTREMSNLMLVLANGSSSETRLRALASRTGTRAEQLWGCTANSGSGCEYVTVTSDHVMRARNLP